jgi:hydrogenase maturation factor
VQGGGNLFVSGAEIGFELTRSAASASDRAFYQDILRAQYLADSAETFVAKGTGGVLGTVGRIGFNTPDRLVVNYPDQIAAMGGSQVILTYEGGIGGGAAIQYQGSYRLVHFGFPFESIDSRESRRAVMNNVLSFLLQ